MEVVEADAEGRAFRLVVDERHLQGYGTGHGGILVTASAEARAGDGALVAVALGTFQRFPLERPA